MFPHISPSFLDPNRLRNIQALLPEIDALYEKFAEENHIPGYSYGIMLDSILIHSGSHGYLNLNKKTPVTTQSMFRIASMTKSFTAMAILKLRDEGKLKLDDLLSQYIPQIIHLQLPQDAPPITIQDLLIHAAGLPLDDPWADRKLAETDQDLIVLLKNGIAFSNATGITFEYSNLGYTLLGYIIKIASGLSYAEYISKYICQPLDIKAYWNFKEIPNQHLAHGYRWSDQKWQEEELLPHGIFGAMGGMLTSVESFSRYAALHLSAWPPRDEKESAPLKRSSLREMHRPWNFTELEPHFKYSDGHETCLTQAYGYGLKWIKDSLGRIYVGHSGGLPGFGSNWYILPEYGLGVIFLANVTYAPAVKINLDVLDKLIRQANLKPRQYTPSKRLEACYNEIVRLLPDWINALQSDYFAGNFFLDYPLNLLKNETQTLFDKAGKIKSVGEIIPKNQLKGHFIMHGEKANLQVNFALTPENPPLIQEFQIKLIN